MAIVTVRAGASGAMEEVIFGTGNSRDGADASPYDYLLMSLGA
jgi:hypothetical protein